MSTRPRVGISACLLGESVRYDGGDKREARLLDALAGVVELVPVCPEVEAGFGVPREPIHLVERSATGRAAVAVFTESGREVTSALASASARLVRQAIDLRLAGFILKSRSPSCGIGDVPLVDTTGAAVAMASGLFARALRAALPDLPIEDEVRLRDRDLLGQFLSHVHAFASTASSPFFPPRRPR